MPELSIILDGDGAWPDLTEELQAQGKFGWDLHTKMSFARLKGGMQSGNDSVAIRLDFPDGSVIVAQTTMRLFLMAADAFRAAQK